MWMGASFGTETEGAVSAFSLNLKAAFTSIFCRAWGSYIARAEAGGREEVVDVS